MRQIRESAKFKKFKDKRTFINIESLPSYSVYSMYCNTTPCNKGFMIQFPLIQNEDFTLRCYKNQQQKQRKRNFKAMKISSKPLQNQRKRNHFNCKNKLGLDIKKVNWQFYNKQHQQQCGLQLEKFPLGRLTGSSSIKKPRKSSPQYSSKTYMLRKNTQQVLQDTSNQIMMLEMESTIFEKEQKSQNINKSYFSSPKKKFRKYLYQKLAAKPILLKREFNNLVYEKRIKSYQQFIWKINFAHNIYVDLALQLQDFFKIKKFKAFVGFGNNSSMIKSLLKRRFWWVICQDQNEKDLSFIWTQIKVNSIFDAQKKGLKQNIKFKQQEEINDQQKKLFEKSAQKFKKNLFKRNKKQISNFQAFNFKIMNNQDVQTYRQYYDKYEKNHQKQRSFEFKKLKLRKILKDKQQNQYPLIHNHLQNNFCLGNKKALFHNLKEYYQLIGQNLYDYIPLTFHIRKGIKDPEYKKFVSCYQKRKALIKKQQQQQQQQQDINKKKKTRNIWIVKPGQNSNRGKGITVIDQVYQLNSIIKEEQKKIKQKDNNNNQKTYIVQMYIDRPFLYNNRKFDLRHYMIITNLYGITKAYWYQQGYIRTSSYQFNIHQFQPEIHLTNDAIQKKYPQYGKYQPANKVSYSQFQRYLDTTYKQKKYNFKKSILDKMKKIATDCAKSVYTKISPKNQMHNFQILGFDFMIDKNFQPWLIEINTNPCLQINCPILDRVIPYMVQQTFKVTLDTIYPPPCHYPNSMKHLAPMINLETFKLQLIFDSQIQGQKITAIYKKSKMNLIEQIGEISDDQTFKDDGKQIKLEQFS